MALIDRKEDVIVDESTKECTCCGQLLWNKNARVQNIVWRTRSGVLFMHPECAMHLATRLIHDVVSMDFPTKGVNLYEDDAQDIMIVRNKP